MVADLHYPTLIHDHDLVCIADSGQAVGNDEAGAVFHELDHGILDLLFRTGVNRGGCLVQDQDLGICQNRTGNGHELPLSVGQVGTCLL